ncbi:MAG: S8 family serine peptidase, partial [Bdellovibrionales bacterium]|nr:S8 family serine peptidase [Bdellovibrionales bacterium]
MWLQLWGLKNHGQDAPGGIEGTVGADIGALEAWQKTTGDRSVVVAVLDTGIDYLHPDLAQNIWVNMPEKTGVPGVDDDGNGYVDDIHGWNAVSDFRAAP